RRFAMRAVVLGLVSVIAFLAVRPATSSAADEPLRLTPEQETAFYRWWDERGFPDVTKLPFVKAATANWIRYGHDDPTTIYEHGFLVADEGATFRLFATDLTRRRLTKSKPGVREWERVGFEEEDLLGFVRSGIAAMRAHKGAVQWHEDASLDPFRAHRW